jgi:hypothetical protein
LNSDNLIDGHLTDAPWDHLGLKG